MITVYHQCIYQCDWNSEIVKTSIKYESLHLTKKPSNPLLDYDNERCIPTNASNHLGKHALQPCLYYPPYTLVVSQAFLRSDSVSGPRREIKMLWIPEPQRYDNAAVHGERLKWCETRASCLGGGPPVGSWSFVCDVERAGTIWFCNYTMYHEQVLQVLMNIHSPHSGERPRTATVISTCFFADDVVPNVNAASAKEHEGTSTFQSE